MEWMGVFSIKMLQDKTVCLRQHFADYLHDDSPNGLLLSDDMHTGTNGYQ
jgi:hypothetical protein